MIAIIEYGVGNVGSVLNMLRKMGEEAVIARDAEIIQRADKLILPGVGAFAHGIERLNQTGLVPLLHRRVIEERTPTLGICLGLQMMTTGSEEGTNAGLGWLPARTIRFRFTADSVLKIPHMGWNSVRLRFPREDWPSLLEEPRFYFVHSFHLECDDQQDIVATASYGYDFPAVVSRGNVSGTQFHPEKSHKFGMALLHDFVGRR